MIETIIAVVMPVVVTFGSQLIKQVPVIANAASWRIPVIRAVVAVLSLIGAVLTQMIGGEAVTDGMIETTALAVFNGVGATLLYFYLSKVANK